jgi:hypothetical protein
LNEKPYKYERNTMRVILIHFWHLRKCMIECQRVSLIVIKEKKRMGERRRKKKEKKKKDI